MLWAFVCRGKNRGIRLEPHRYVRDGGRFHVAKAKEAPPIAVHSEAEIIRYLQRGLSLRMSNRSEGYPPSLIKPKSIKGW